MVELVETRRAVANFGDFRDTPLRLAPRPAFSKNLRNNVTTDAGGRPGDGCPKQAWSLPAEALAGFEQALLESAPHLTVSNLA